MRIRAGSKPDVSMSSDESEASAAAAVSVQSKNPVGQTKSVAETRQSETNETKRHASELCM